MNIARIVGPDVANPAGQQSSAAADCPAGQVLTGGGGFTSGFFVNHQSLNASYPQDTNTWRIFVDNQGATAQTISAYAICTTPSSMAEPAGAAVSK